MKHRAMPWTPEQEAMLREEALAGRPVAEIASMMGRSLSAVRSRAFLLRVMLRQPKSKLAPDPER
jgi:DNA-directed RNA polymerase specialized sigma24 family protein